MRLSFTDYADVANTFIAEVVSKVAGAQFGASQQSCSRYAYVDIYEDVNDNEDEDEEFLERRVVRFSDHASRNTKQDEKVFDVDIRSLDVENHFDDCGEFYETTVDWDIAKQQITRAVNFLLCGE